MSHPARLVSSTPEWAERGAAEADRVRVALRGLADAGTDVEHIGSTSVPGLAAKPILDLQARVPVLPTLAALGDALAPLGYEPVAVGSRADSPGVTSDIPRPDTDPDPRTHVKRMLGRRGPDGEPTTILHVRRTDSPFAAFVLAFRDWLRADPAHAARYLAVKSALVARHADDADYDDYTRGKSAFLDEAQREMGWPAAD
ncbi:GrpB family protein [Microbacterium gorillae]|uniref:GrpB family protein n=1 Tax=Microbacterium gorillae TaxID=1231063 RepID=UPI000694EE1C|nr:GrpB family protein [Microbacterium gorillae]